MGTVGRQVIKLDTEELIDDLNKDVAAELHDAYRYLLLSKTVSGPRASSLNCGPDVAATVESPGPFDGTHSPTEGAAGPCSKKPIPTPFLEQTALLFQKSP